MAQAAQTQQTHETIGDVVRDLIRLVILSVERNPPMPPAEVELVEKLRHALPEEKEEKEEKHPPRATAAHDDKHK